MVNPIVTVVVPSYNSAHFLKWTLASIAAQTLKNFECIVVDDCSTDQSIADAKAFFKDPRFRLIRHKMNVGLSGARNTGLRAAHGRYVAFLDSDDLMMANSLEVRVASCRWGERTSDRFAGSYCGSVQIEEDLETAPDSKPQELDFVDFVSSNGLCPFNANQPMLRRDILRASGGFNQALKQAEDFDLWQRILRAGYVFAPSKHCSVTYRKRAGSMIRREPLTHLHTSLSIINSTEKVAARDQLDWSSYRMPKTIGSYAAQKRKMQRIFEFVGMNIASNDPDPLEDLARVVAQEIPDFSLIVNPAQSVDAMIHKGVVRQVGKLEEANKRKTSELVARVMMELETFAPFDGAEVATSTVYDDIIKDRPWFTGAQQKARAVFIPHSAYHVWTIALLASDLKKRGIDFVTIDISPEWRDGGVRRAALEYGVELIGLSEFVIGQYAPTSIVTFNDWDPLTRPILVVAKAAGIKTIAIVEGIQDYDDADVHWQRWAYKTSDVVLLPGDFDRKYFEGHNAVVEVGGIPRMEILRGKAPRHWDPSRSPRVLINSNFSYGVLEEFRDQWLTDCVQTVVALGMTPVISRHPADKGVLYPEYLAGEGFYDVLETCDVSIQRFASGVLEALARQVGVIYHNPHGEKVDKFQSNPMNAYVLTSDTAELRGQLQEWWALHERAKNYGPAFLDHHTGEMRQGVIERCADALAAHQDDFPTPLQLSAFRSNLEAIDLETRSFSQVRVDGVALFPNPSVALEKLEGIKNAHKARISSVMRKLPVVVDFSDSKSVSAISGDDDGLNYIRSLAQELLIDRNAALSKVGSPDVASLIKKTLAELGQDHDLAVHYRRVFDFVTSCKV